MMASAEILTIGTELLLGEIVDTNASYLAKALNDAGYDIFRITTVGDNVDRIAVVLQEAMARNDLVITTGGLGPTIDDPTRDAAALAIGRKSNFHEDLWEQIEERFRSFKRKATENNKRQAYLPETATAIPNEVGTAPAFYLEFNNSILICLPGVPSEMKFLFERKVIPLIQNLIPANAVLVTRTIHTIGLGESRIDQKIGHLEKLSNPTVGLAAHLGEVDIRICAKAEKQQAAEAMIKPIEKEIQDLFGHYIYGFDGADILEVTAEKYTQKDIALKINVSEELIFLEPVIEKFSRHIEIIHKQNNKKYQYNNKKEKTVEFTLALDKSTKKPPLLRVSIQEANEVQEETFKFLYNPTRFEEWVKNRMLRVLFRYIHIKG